MNQAHTSMPTSRGVPDGGCPARLTRRSSVSGLVGVAQMAVADYLAARGVLQPEAFTAERFVLYSARDGTGGGPYVVEAAYPLGEGRL